MKKIINWSFGAFFRTIGRIFAYFLIGILLLIIGSKLGLNFGYMKVDALTMQNWAESLPILPRVQVYECQTSNKCYDKELSIQGLTTDNGNRDFALTQYLTLDPGGIAVQVNANVLKPGYLYLTNLYICANKTLDNLSSIEIYNSDYNTPGVRNTTYDNASYASLSNTPGNGDQTFPYCKQYSGLYVPNKENNWVTLRIKQASSTSNFALGIIGYENKELGIYSDTIKTIVEQSNGNVKQAVDEVKEETKKTNDTLNDDDTTEADGKISGFFNEFNDNSHGLTAIITAPLNAVNAMLSTTCTAPTATYKGSTFSLPCGSILWNQEGAESFKTFINLIYGGLVCYGILKSLFKDVNDLKNPDNDRVDVMDL